MFEAPWTILELEEMFDQILTSLSGFQTFNTNFP